MVNQLVYEFEKDESLSYMVVWKQIENPLLIGQVRYKYKECAIKFAKEIKGHVYLLRTMEKICY